MTTKELILAALASGGSNATFLPVHVQKLFFLLDREGSHLLDGPHFHFVPYDYGPFDSSVYDRLDFLRVEGLVSVDAAGRFRRYSLTPEGRSFGLQILQTLPAATQKFIGDTAAWVSRLSFQQLVAAIYRRYPEMKANSIFR